jgi:hypothetical protein
MPTAGTACYFFIITFIRRGTTAAARWASLLIVRTLFDESRNLSSPCNRAEQGTIKNAGCRARVQPGQAIEPRAIAIVVPWPCFAFRTTTRKPL